MGKLTLLVFLVVGVVTLEAQKLDVQGKAKIVGMDTVTNVSSNVVRMSDGTLATRQYKIGDFAQGGIVFWVDESGEHGLACAKTDQSASMRWYAGTYGNTQSKGVGPYSGEANTVIIITAHVAIGDDGNPYAARICNELQITEGGKTYGDWYLPSKEELFLLYSNKSIIDATATNNGGTAFASGPSDLYWSSSEGSSNGAYWQWFDNGAQVNVDKDDANYVRAVRAF